MLPFKRKRFIDGVWTELTPCKAAEKSGEIIGEELRIKINTYGLSIAVKHVNPVSEPERGGSDVAVCQETLGKMSKLSIIPTCHTKEFVVEGGCLPLESVFKFATPIFSIWTRCSGCHAQ